MLIHQHAHQFRHRHRRMGIIELEGCFFMELPDIVMLPHILCHRFLYRRGDKEILLFQTKLFSGIMVVVRIEHFHDIARKVLLFHSLLVVALIKGIQLETLNRLRIPDTQRINDAVAVTYDRHIVGDRFHGLIAFLTEVASAVFIHIYIDIAAELYFLRIFRPSQFKRISVFQPVIGYFDLEAVPDLLFKHAVMVPDTTAVSRIAQCRQGIQKTCRQTSKSAVAERRIRFLILYDIQIHTQFIQRFLNRIIRLQIDDIIAQRTAHQKLHGHIVYHFGVLFFILFLGLHPVIHYRVLDRIGHRLKNLLGCCFLQCFSV